MPLATSTANGSVARIASSTLSGVRPPAVMSGTGERCARTRPQSNGTPPAPSSRWKSVVNGWSATTSAREEIRAALMTFAPVRRATSAA